MDSAVKKNKARPRTRAKKSSDASGKTLLRIEAAIHAIPLGKVSTYGGVARAAGLPGAARLVARVLRRSFGLPWQRVLGAGGEIKLRGDSAIEQRLRLEAEGVRFRGRKVDMKACEWKGRKSAKSEPCHPEAVYFPGRRTYAFPRPSGQPTTND
jgi:methylated-DNA-protein-cysteine methyltransferase-like protein